MDKDVKELSQIPKIVLNKISEYNMNPPIDLQKSEESLVPLKMLFPKQLTELIKMPRIRLLKHNLRFRKPINIDKKPPTVQQLKSMEIWPQKLIQEYNSISKDDKKLSIPLKKIDSNEIKITRGGNWEIKGNQSLFNFKVKVNNDSKYTITDIHILLTSIPSSLEVSPDHKFIKKLKPHTYESPSFEFVAKESCVGDFIQGFVTYFDYLHNQQTITIESFKIKYVCNLLVPKPISKQEFDQKTKFMEEKKLIIESNLELSKLETVIESIIQKCHFALLQDLQTSQSDEFKKFEAYAQGLYDKQDVALTIAVKKIDNGSKLIVKTMSDQSDKVTDILKDFNIKLDDIKSDTQLNLEYSGQIEQILGKVDNLEGFLKDKLSSDFEKIRYFWEDYSAGKIKRRELIGKCIKILGKKFIRLVISNVTLLG